ncbi:DNA-directed RNA polymerase, mitochondrial isoform X2 [Cheilinus undulatus]|uniref:DNA-directed RNA polymerase, mitochondrial isoform X2 n=1 Tax=Cheilinus undulatus TaxID=241271 RepID=UPI001BD1CD55|nr:DNA-directed RNA polymerase, mitochondrial isoform X2 [Cheilinus undulatus]
MSLLRVSAFAKCLNRRSLFEKCAIRVSLADCCQCVSLRSGAVRRISVLEARIHQLQADIVLDVHHAKVQIVKAPSSGRGGFPGKGPKIGSPEKTGITQSEQTVSKGASKSQPSRWMEKLSKEKKTKLKKLQNIQRNADNKAANKSKGNTSSSMLPGTSHKIISTSAKKTSPLTKKSKGHKKLADEIPDVVSTSTAAPSAAALHKMSRERPKQQQNQIHSEETQTVTDAESRAKELAEVEELERRLNHQAGHLVYSRKSQRQQDTEGVVCRNMQMSIHSYLEACVFAGEIERAHSFLLNQHRIVTRRKFLNADIYNIVMRVWAKKGTLNQIGRVFILLEEASLKPNLGSYCSALECMGRIPNCSPKIVKRCLEQMKEDGLSVDDMFNQCVFRQDERDVALKAIRIVQPDYEPKLNSNTRECYPPLVQDYYTQRADHQYPKLDFTREELQERFSRQLSMEQACTITIDSVEGSKVVTENMAKMRKLLADQRAQWQKILLQALRESKMIQPNPCNRSYKLNLYPYLFLLEDREYVDIMIQSVANMPPSGDALKTFASDLGNRVFTKYSVRQKNKNQMVEKLGNIYNCYVDLLARDHEACDALPRELWCNLETKHSPGPTLQGGEIHWPYTVTLELGTFMVDLMIKNLKINSDILDSTNDRKLIPILYHMYTFRSTRQVGFIKPHPILTQMQQEAMETKLTFDSYVMPMLCPPIPWTSVKFGTYLLTPTKLMRSVEGATQHEVLLEKCQNLHAVLDSLNQLGNCAWRINKPMLDIMISIFNDRGSEKLDIPPPMSEAPEIPYFNPKDPVYTADEKTHMKREVIKAKKKCSEMHSLRMDALYKLSIANHMRDEVFWFPHNMDFRGRTYPCPPYFNHLGSDVTRAILVFAEGKKLGPKGLDWLKIHLVNLTGLKKKSSMQGRLEYANTIMDDILDSADNPFTGKKWWMNADEPWQALACCMEIANAVRFPDPTQFISHFPVHQDGSCNGLQHYAALGRDVIGATSVNLMPCDVPQDVYSGVAQQVEEFRARDAEQGLKIAQVLEGFISRKVVKQTVMTVVYGVTRYGGRLQIEKRLREIDEFPKDYIWDASHYLVRLVFSGLKEMFTGTREIQDWLTESATLISKSGHTVEWVTPLGLPVIQPYHRTRTHVFKSAMQDINLQISYDTKERPDTMKQKNAFPPNFIHSLDSTHMMLTALHCYSAGLTFVSVHDCFWTHALTVDTMNKICREQFVALHSQPILQELSTFLLEKYCNNVQAEAKNKKYQAYRKLMLLLANVPQTGDFDLKQVKESTFFFS